MVVQAHLKSGGGELTRENVRLMGGAVAALRREQCAAAAQEAAAAAVTVGEAAGRAAAEGEAAKEAGEAAAEEAGEAAAEEAGEAAAEEAGEAAAALVARISVLDDQSARLTTSFTTPLPAVQEIETSHPEQPGLGQAWLLALGDFNLDPAQVLDEVRALELLATDLTLAAPPACSTDRATTY